MAENKNNKNGATRAASTGNNTDKEAQARVDELLANPNRSTGEDAELDKLLHGNPPVKTGDVRVDPVGTARGTGLVDRATLRGDNGAGDLNVVREIPNPNNKEANEKPAPDATETGASTAGSAETTRSGQNQPNTDSGKGSGKKDENK